MKNTIYNYIELRGNLNVHDFPYNEIDYLILSEFAYIHFDGIVDAHFNHVMTLKQVYDLFCMVYKDESKIEDQSYYKCLKALKLAAQSPRYQNIQIVSYVNDIDKDLIKQFSATTYLLEDQTMFVAFRGTDDTLIGWHEDFLMLCDEIVPAQKSSVRYLEYVSQMPYKNTLMEDLHQPCLGQSYWDRLKKHFEYKKKRPILLGGHSKGGNLAMYSACFSSSPVQERIRHVYNYDGPGFHEEILRGKEYQNMLPRICSYIPHYSFFGITLGHEEEYHVVKSYNQGMIQHDATSWQVSANGFVYDELSSGSVDYALKVLMFLNHLTVEEKYIVVNTMFGLFDSLGLVSFSDLAHISFKQIVMALKQMTLLEQNVRKMLLEVLHMIWLESMKSKEDTK